MAWFSYSVVKFIPDPVKDERVNVGVIVLGDDGLCKSRFTGNFKFIKTTYSINDVDLLEFALSNYKYESKQDSKHLEKLHADSIRDHRIKIESPCATRSKTIDTAVDELFFKMINIPKKQAHRSSLTNNIKHTLYNEIKIERKYVKTSYEVSGAKNKSKYDFVFKNEKISDILQTMSFDVDDLDKSLYKSKSFVFDATDIHKLDKDIQCIAYVPTPKNHCEQHRQAISVLSESDDCKLTDETDIGECLMKIKEKHM